MVCLSFKLPHASFRQPPSTPRCQRFDVSRVKPSPGMSEEERAAVVERVKSFQRSVALSLCAASTDHQESDRLSVEERWGTLRDSLVHAGHEHLGYARRCQPDWFLSGQEVLAPLFRERTMCYNRWVTSQLDSDYTQFKVARSRARAATRRAKNVCLADVAQEAETGRLRGGQCGSPSAQFNGVSTVSAECLQWQ